MRYIACLSEKVLSGLVLKHDVKTHKKSHYKYKKTDKKSNFDMREIVFKSISASFRFYDCNLVRHAIQTFLIKIAKNYDLFYKIVTINKIVCL